MTPGIAGAHLTGHACAGDALAPRMRPEPQINAAQSEYLNALRGAAAQLVLIQHALSYCFPGARYDEFGLGALGVLIFFLLSGFLITFSITTKAARGDFDIAEFLVGRFSRIYTPYVPAILLVALLDHFSIRFPDYTYQADYNWPTAMANVFMLQDFPVFQVLRRLHVPDQSWFFKTFGSGRQFWTVSIEWWIYVSVGLTTAFALSRRRVWPGWRVLLIFAAVEPVYNFIGGPGNCLTLAWLLGGGACLVVRRMSAAFPDRPSQGGLLAAVCCVLLVLAGARLFFTGGRVYEAEFALLLTGALFTPMLHYRSVERISLGRWIGLDRLSFHSYSLYLTHGSIVVFMAALHPALLQGWRGMAVVIAVTNVFAVGFACLFELPHHRVRLAILRTVRPAASLSRRALR